MVGLVLVSVAAFGKRNDTPLKIVSKSMDVVYFKVSNDMIGASMEVVDANGAVVYSAQVTDKKVIVDFYGAASGEYKIRLKKDDNAMSISFNKSSVSHAELAGHNAIIVTQN